VGAFNDLLTHFGIPTSPVLPYIYVTVVFTATQGTSGAVPSLTGTAIDSATVEVSSVAAPEPGAFLMLAFGAIALILVRHLCHSRSQETMICGVLMAHRPATR
jgi:hypothetical protein